MFCVIFSLLYTTLYAANTPTAFPTYNPTPVPTARPTVVAPPTATSLQAAAGIIAQHQLIVVEPSGNTVIKLKFYDGSTTDFKFGIQTLPQSGSLYQLSQVYSNYGYEPKHGQQITSKDKETVVTGSNNRVYYTRPKPDVATNQMVSCFFYLLSLCF